MLSFCVHEIECSMRDGPQLHMARLRCDRRLDKCLGRESRCVLPTRSCSITSTTLVSAWRRSLQASSAHVLPPDTPCTGRGGVIAIESTSNDGFCTAMIRPLISPASRSHRIMPGEKFAGIPLSSCGRCAYHPCPAVASWPSVRSPATLSVLNHFFSCSDAWIRDSVCQQNLTSEYHMNTSI